jgi:hypothetical protein
VICTARGQFSKSRKGATSRKGKAVVSVSKIKNKVKNLKGFYKNGISKLKSAFELRADCLKDGISCVSDFGKSKSAN